MARQKLAELGEGDEYELRPADSLTYDASDPEQRKVVSWRVACFEALGFGTTAAIAMAVRKDIDRTQVEAMLSGGATLAQVVEIVL